MELGSKVILQPGQVRTLAHPVKKDSSYDTPVTITQLEAGWIKVEQEHQPSGQLHWVYINEKGNTSR